MIPLLAAVEGLSDSTLIAVAVAAVGFAGTVVLLLLRISLTTGRTLERIETHHVNHKELKRRVDTHDHVLAQHAVTFAELRGAGVARHTGPHAAVMLAPDSEPPESNR